MAAVLVPAALALVAMLAWWAGAESRHAWNAAWTAAALSALAGMLVAHRAAAPAERPRWTWWVAASACWLAGQVVWDVSGLAGTPPFPSAADVGWYAFAILVVVGLLRTHDGTRASRVVAVVEVLPLIAAVMALTFSELWTDVAASELSLGARGAALAYPAVYVLAAVVTLQAMLGGSLRRVRGGGSRVVLAGIVAQAIAFILWSGELLRVGNAPATSLADALWLIGMLAMGAGGALAARSAERDATVEEEPGAWGGVLPSAVFVVLIAALLWTEFADRPLPARLMVAAGLVICGVTLITRSVLLGRRLRVLLNRERLARRALAGREAELAQLNERLRHDIRLDPLTALRNRRALAEDLPVLEELARRHGEPYAIALCDADRFKAYNDELGHLAGDEALRAVAATVRGVLRTGDAAYRYGGEELLLLLRGTDARAALVTAERVRAAVEAAALVHPADPSGVLTVSVGVAAGTEDGATLLSRADEALYRAKRAGRNRVLAASDTQDAAVPLRAPLGDTVDEPVLRQLLGLLAITRAGMAGRGPEPVLEALARTIRSELRFQTVVVNLRERGGQDVRAAFVAGAEEVRAALFDTVSPWGAWEDLLDARYERCGARWLPAGAYDWDPEVPSWVPAPTAVLDADAWDPEDTLLLPLRGSDGNVAGVVSVDEPLSGRRPTDAELRVLMAVADHAALALEQGERARSAPEHRLAAVMLLAEALDLRDAGTAEHSRTVGAYARETAATLGLAPSRVERLHAAGVLHDLGKLGIADAILHKPDALDEAEWREIQRHPEVGARILEHAGLRDIADWVRAHHERVDGTGYPGRLAAGEIPIEARILAVADAYEAMIADRPYRRGLPPERARAELLRCAGTQFDLAVVAAFVRTLDGAAFVPDAQRRAA